MYVIEQISFCESLLAFHVFGPFSAKAWGSLKAIQDLVVSNL